MTTGKPDYELDYVYMKNADMSFERVHVLLNIQNERMVMTIQSEEDIAPEDISEILDGLETGTLRKMHIKYGVNCDVQLSVGEKLYKTNVSKEKLTVVTLSPAE